MGLGPDISATGCVFAIDAANIKSYNSGSTPTDIVNLINTSQTGSLKSGTSYADGTWVFDGTDDHIELASNASGSVFETQTSTIDIWYKTNFDSQYEVLFSCDYTSHNPPFYSNHLRIDNPGLVGGNGLITHRRNNNVALDTNTTINMSNNTWHHFVATKTQTSTNIYLDGVNVASATYAFTEETYYNQEVWLGRGNWATGWIKGNVSSFKFYNRALTAQEVLQNYNTTKRRFGKK